MSTSLDQYREMAVKARADAAATTLPNVQQLHLASAARLDQMARQVESVAEAKSRNEAAKLLQTRSDEEIWVHETSLIANVHTQRR